MKKLKYYVVCLLFLFTFSSCHNYHLFGPVGQTKSKKGYYTGWADNAPGTKFNTHKRYNKKNVNQHRGKTKYKKKKNIDRSCPF